MSARAWPRAWIIPVLVALAAHGALALVPLPLAHAPHEPAALRIQLRAGPRTEAPDMEAEPRPPGPAMPGEPEPDLLARNRPEPPQPPPEPPGQPARPGKLQARPGPRTHDMALPGPDVVRPAEELPSSEEGLLASSLPDLDQGPSGTSALAALPGAQPPPAPDAADPLAYGRLVRSLIEAEKRYPLRARRSGQEGVVTIVVRIGPDGRLLAAPRIAESSGVASLDREALGMARRASPFPASPAWNGLEIAVPVRFSLQER